MQAHNRTAHRSLPLINVARQKFVLVNTLGMILALLMYCQIASADSDSACMKVAQHEAVTYFLVDRTDKLENVEQLKQTIAAVRSMVQPGERLIVGVSTGKGSDARILMDLTVPKSSLWVSKLKTRADEKKFNDCFSDFRNGILVQDESHKHSALVETLRFVGKVLKADEAKRKRLIVFSDMIQNSNTLSFYKARKMNVKSLINKVEDEYLLGDFKGVEVHVSGAGGNVAERKGRAIEAFWGQYFEKSGGELKFYGPVLVAS